MGHDELLPGRAAGDVRRIVEETSDRVRALLGAKKPIPLRAAEILKRRETLRGDELRRPLARRSGSGGRLSGGRRAC